MRLLYNKGDRPAQNDIEEGDDVYNLQDSKRYTKTHSGDIVQIDSSPLTGYKNLLINGGFDVWQRGDTGSGSFYHSVDRWMSGAGSTTRFDKVDVSNELPTYYGLVQSGAFLFGQAIESVIAVGMTNQTVTLSFDAKQDAGITVVEIAIQYAGARDNYTDYEEEILSTSINIGTSFERHSHTFTITNPKVKNGMRIYIRAPDGNGDVSKTWTMARIQLELGDTATNFEYRSYPLERSLCYRYYQIQQFSSYRIAASNSGWAWGGQVALTSTMRVSPTIDDSDLTFTDCTKEGFGVFEDTCYIRVDTTGNEAHFIVNGQIKLDAEIYD